MELWQSKVNALLDLIPTATGVFLVALATILIILCIITNRTKWICLTVILWMATIYEPLFGLINRSLESVLIFPLQQIRNNNVLIGTGCFIILLLPALLARRGWRLTLVPMPLTAYFIFQIVMSVHSVFSEEAGRAVLGIVIFTIQYSVLCIGVNKWLQTDRDVHILLLTIAVAATLFCGASALQTLINPKMVVLDNRFLGTTGNPQFAGQILGITIPVLAYLLVGRQSVKWLRVMTWCTIGLASVFLAWTGSRTALVIAGVSLLVLFRHQSGRLTLLVALGSAAVWIGITIFGNQIHSAQRLLDSTDTRTVAWQEMMQDFLKSPIVGVPNADYGGAFRYTENSYLSAGSHYGLIGFIPLMVMVGFLIRQGFQVNRIRILVKDNASLCDLVVAIFAGSLCGAMFDSFLMAQFNMVVYMIFLMSCVGQYLQDKVQVISLGLSEQGGYETASPHFKDYTTA